MTFAELVQNREWEKIFDLLDEGTIEFSYTEKLSRTPRTSVDGETTDEYVRTRGQSLKINWEFLRKRNLKKH